MCRTEGAHGMASPGTGDDAPAYNVSTLRGWWRKPLDARRLGGHSRFGEVRRQGYGGQADERGESRGVFDGIYGMDRMGTGLIFIPSIHLPAIALAKAGVNPVKKTLPIE
jgi:hypothetical protein